MIRIGDICPVYFNPLKYEYANKCSYRNCIDTEDGIQLQVFCDEGETPTATLNDKLNSTSSDIVFASTKINEDITMFHAELRPIEGIYTITLEGKESEDFEVCENAGGILIEYSHKDNNSVFDNIFWMNDSQIIFKMRIQGGFKPSGISLAVDNEQFVNQKQEIVELYSIPYSTRTLIIGGIEGVPYYIAEMINKILCLSSVKIGKDYYVREGNSVPELVETIGKKEMFIYSVTLREGTNKISGIGGQKEESVTATGVSFAINNPNDGEVLVYSDDENAFINTNKLDSI